jgi:hypothetical protein
MKKNVAWVMFALPCFADVLVWELSGDGITLFEQTYLSITVLSLGEKRGKKGECEGRCRDNPLLSYGCSYMPSSTGPPGFIS